MLLRAALAAFMALPACAATRAESRAEPLRQVFYQVPASWHEPIGEFLDSSIDEETLYRRLLPISQRRSEIDLGAASRFATELSAKAAATDSPEHRFALAARFVSLESVLSAFIPEEHLAGLRAVSAGLVPEEKKEALLETARRTAQAMAGLRPDGAHLPVVGEFATDDATMDLRAEIDLGFIRESLPQMRYDPSGAVYFNEDDGFPDERSYVVAHKAATLLRDDPEGKWVLGDDRKMLQGLSEVFRKTEDIIFSKGNESARTVRYVEPMAGGLNMTILRYVETEQFKQGPFWVSSNDRTLEAPEGFADVDAQTARGPFLKSLKLEEFIEKMGRKPENPKELEEFKSSARSRFFWAAKPGGFGVPDVDGMRVRVNSDWKGNDRTLEVLAPVGFDPDGEVRWKGFFFKKIEGRWVSGAPAKLNPAMKCINCHFRLDANGKKRHTPLPHGKLKTREDYLAVGYKNTRLLDRYLLIGHRALENDGDLSLPAPTR